MHHIYSREEVEQEDTSPYIGSIPRDNQDIQLNGNIHMTRLMLKLVAASAAKAESRALFLNAQEARTIRLPLVVYNPLRQCI